MKAREIMTADVEIVSPNASICEAARKMQSCDIGMLPVCDGERMVGTLTDRDITVRAVARGYDPVNTPVREIMTSSVAFCRDNDSMEAAARMMERKQIRRLPVIDSAERLVGIISVGDIAVRAHDEQLLEEVMERVCEPA